MARRKYDETDIRILEKLVENIRKGNKQIGKELKLKRQVVDYRIKKMEANGTILGYRMMLNFSRLGLEYRRLHIKLKEADKKRKGTILDFLARQRRSIWVVDCDGRHDILAGIVSDDKYEFDGILSDFLVRFNQYIQYCEVSDILEVITPTRDFSGSRDMRGIQGHVVGNFPAERPSDLDKKIINELARDGSRSAMEIAKEVGAEPANVNYHIKQIMKKGLVFSNIQFGYDLFGFELYKTLIYIKKPERKRLDALKRFARTQPRIWNYIETLAPWRIEFDIESKGHEDYYAIMDAMMEQFSDIVFSYDTLYIREERKFLFEVF